MGRGIKCNYSYIPYPQMLMFTETLAKSETSLLVRNVGIEKTGDSIVNILMAVFFFIIYLYFNLFFENVRYLTPLL